MKSLQKFSEISEDECTKINGGGLLLDGFGYWGIATAIVGLGKEVWSHRKEYVSGYEAGRK